jgi:hypothetical protein
VVGFQGAQGSQGANTGAQGHTGPQGPVGAQGSQSGTPGAQGVVGFQGAQGSSPGPQGAQNGQGAPGARGPQGAQGFAGPAGPPGPQGFQGPPGFTGPPGTFDVPGPQGAQGPSGGQGSQGNQGPTGPPSDRRLKDNIKKIENPLATIKKIDGVSFLWDDQHPKIKDNKTIAQIEYFSGSTLGFIAQDMEEVLPEVVFTDDDGYKSIEYTYMVSIGVGGVQENQKKIESILERINALKESINA